MGTVLSRGTGGAGRGGKDYEPLQRIIERDLDVDTNRETPAQPQALEMVEESSEAPSPTTPDRHPHADAPEAPAALSEAAAEALERYKRSAAAAATAAEPHTASGTGYTEMQAGLANNQLPLPKRRRPRKITPRNEAQPAAAGEAQRSLKRKAQPAPLADEPGERPQRKDACSAPGAPEQAVQAASAEGRRRRRSAATTGRKRPRHASPKWSYPAAALSRDDAPTERWVHCPDGRSYPSSLACKDGDILLENYYGKTDDSQLYEVDYIIDERRHGDKRSFRVKWKGFEMNPEEWIPYKNLGECEAMDVWEMKLGIMDS